MKWDKLQPKYVKVINEGKKLNPDCTIVTDIPIITSTIREAAARFYVYNECGEQEQYRNIIFKRGMTTETVNRIREVLGDVYVENNEGYFIDSTGQDIIVRSPSERGLFYGAQAIAVMLEKPGNIIPSLVAHEYPIVPERGVKCYIPGMDHISFFKQFVDMMCRYRHNTLLIEIGGAMEYKRYPEINVEWVKYCDDISEYSGKSTQIQEATYTWRKDSMHVENGDGGFITQEVIRELVLYCKERYINVIPEVLCLSHCDYICRAFPEIAERTNDPYPDAYCPSHPKTYSILFGILDEIIDVFEPETVHIGHDEYYTYGKCPRCKGKDPANIFADDVNKIYDYLHARGLKTMMWADKFLDSYYYEPMLDEMSPCGGAEKGPGPAWSNEDIICEGMGATYQSIEKVPRDIIMHHWYWWDEAYEKEFLNRNMPAIYGNYVGTRHENFKRRMKDGMSGGLCSNWSTLSELIMAWNGVIFDMAYNGVIFWDPDYDFDQRDNTLQSVASDLYHYKNMDALYGEKNGNYIKVTHSTTRDMPYKLIHDGVFLDRNEYLLGHYTVTCDNGRQAKIPLHYGESISGMNESFFHEITGERTADGNVESSINKLKGVCYQALPTIKDGKTWYEAILKIPNHTRGFKITDVTFEKTANDCDVMIDSIEVL